MAEEVNIYNSSQLIVLKNTISEKLYVLNNKVLNWYQYGINKPDLISLYKLYLYNGVILSWNQWDDGNLENPSEIYNSITQEEFTNICIAALNICKN